MDQLLASAKDLMAKCQPFWPQEWLQEVPEGAKMLMIPPTATMERLLMVDMDESEDLLIAVGAEAKVRIMEVGSDKMANQAKVRLLIDKGAQVEYLVDETAPRGGLEAVMEREAVLDAGSKITWFGATLNQPIYRSKTRSWLRGEEAQSDFHWLQLARGEERGDLELANCFDAPNCKGEIYVKAVAQESANVKVTGGIEITLQGGGTDSYLKEDTLLLDKTARVRALPVLEIKTNNVKAGHGATVTNLTAEDLFYLTAHGLPVEEARKLMVQGFLESALADCPCPEFVATVVEKL